MLFENGGVKPPYAIDIFKNSSLSMDVYSNIRFIIKKIKEIFHGYICDKYI